MSRFRDAWRALTGRLEPVTVEKIVEVEKRVEVEVEVERLVPVGDAVVDVFTVESKAYARSVEGYHTARRLWINRKSWHEVGRNGGTFNPYAGSPHPGDEPKKPEAPEWSGRVYRTCAQAFAELGADADLTPRKALIVGDKAYLLGLLAERPLAPKPKVAKGRAK